MLDHLEMNSVAQNLCLELRFSHSTSWNSHPWQEVHLTCFFQLLLLLLVKTDPSEKCSDLCIFYSLNDPRFVIGHDL